MLRGRAVRASAAIGSIVRVRNAALMLLVCATLFGPIGQLAAAAEPVGPTPTVMMGPGNRLVVLWREFAEFKTSDPFNYFIGIEGKAFADQQAILQRVFDDHGKYFPGGIWPENTVNNLGHSTFGPRGRLFSGTWNEDPNAPWPLPGQRYNQSVAEYIVHGDLGHMRMTGARSSLWFGCYGQTTYTQLWPVYEELAPRYGIDPREITVWIPNRNGSVLPYVEPGSLRPDQGNLRVYPLYANHSLLEVQPTTITPYGREPIVYGGARAARRGGWYYGGPVSLPLEFQAMRAPGVSAAALEAARPLLPAPARAIPLLEFRPRIPLLEFRPLRR